jgi:hypothetical protein
MIASAVALAALFALSAPAMADYISNIQANDTTGNLVQVNNVPIVPPFFQGNGQDPVVSAVLSVPGITNPGTSGSKSYSGWSFLIDDGTGGLVIFATTASLLTANSGGNYTPTLGDGLDLKGTYSPFHSLPEVATITQANVTSTGHSVPSAVTGMNIQGILNDCAANGQTVTAGTTSTTVLPNDIGGKLVTLNNVWITSFGTTAVPSSYGTANIQTTLSDSSGSLSMFYWPTSYSSCLANLYGQPIATGAANQYNMTGFLSDFPGLPGNLVEFTPITVTAVPEPGTLALIGTGTMLAAVGYIRRRRRKLTLPMAPLV